MKVVIWHIMTHFVVEGHIYVTFYQVLYILLLLSYTRTKKPRIF